MLAPSNFDHGSTIPFTDEQLHQMADLYQSGVSLRKVGDKFGICQAAVTRRMLAVGVEIRHCPAATKVTDQIALQIIDMRRQGKTWKHISHQLGYAIRTMQDGVARVKRKGIK